MGSIARGNEVGLSVARRKRWVFPVWGNGSSFLCYLVLLFSYCLKQFVYILIKRNQSDSERVCFVVASGVVLAFSSQGVGLWCAA